MPDIELLPGERIARFIYSRSRFSSTRAKPGAFDPAPYDQLSCAHISGLSEEAVWALARLTLTDQPGRDRVYARADLDVEAVRQQGLSAIRDDIPFKGHTTVLGWPLGGDERKERRLEIALQLSLAATLVRADPPVSATERE